MSGRAKKGSHAADARAGTEAFIQSLPDPPSANLMSPSDNAFSLVGAALLRAGWHSDTAVLSQPCLVVRAMPDAV